MCTAHASGLVRCALHSTVLEPPCVQTCTAAIELGEIIASGGAASKAEDKRAKAEGSALFAHVSKALLIRIRCEDVEAALENVARIASLVPGVMLTPGGEGGSSTMLTVRDQIRSRHPGLWVGLNFVGYNLYDVGKILMKVEGPLDGLWMDNSYVQPSGPQSVPEMCLDTLSMVPCFTPTSLYFGGVYHKGWHVPPDAQWFDDPDDKLEATTAKAIEYMDVVCTSGQDTGVPVSVDKISRMHSVTEGKIKLALASGVMQDNIDALLPFADLFIVGTAVHDQHERVLPGQVAVLNKHIAAFGAANTLLDLLPFDEALALLRLAAERRANTQKAEEEQAKAVKADPAAAVTQGQLDADLKCMPTSTRTIEPSAAEGSVQALARSALINQLWDVYSSKRTAFPEWVKQPEQQTALNWGSVAVYYSSADDLDEVVLTATHRARACQHRHEAKVQQNSAARVGRIRDGRLPAEHAGASDAKYCHLL